MKFRKLILLSLIAIFFSACAGPAADMNIEYPTGAEGSGGGGFGDLIGGIGGDIDEGETVVEPIEEPAEEPIEKPTEEPTEEPAEEITEEVVEEAVVESTEKPVEESVEPWECMRESLKNMKDDNERECISIAEKCGVKRKGLWFFAEIAFPGHYCGYGRKKSSNSIPTDSTLYVKKIDITIWTGSREHSGTDSNVFFAMRSGDTSEWPSYDKEKATEIIIKRAKAEIFKTNPYVNKDDKESADREVKKLIADNGQWMELNDPNDGDDRGAGDINEYQQTLYAPMPLDEVTGFTLYHDGGNAGSEWLIKGIEVKAHLVNSDGNPATPVILYCNPWVLNWVDDQSIDFTMNDIAVMTEVVTDSEHHKEMHDGEKVSSGTDNTVFLDINLLAPNAPNWGEFHDFDMGPALFSSSEGLKLLLDWEDSAVEYFYGDLDHNKGLGDIYADFVSLNNVEDFKPDYVNLRLDDGGSGNDWWRPAKMWTYIFKPARVFRKKRGERACWYFQEDMSDGKTVLEPGEESGAYHPETDDCADLLKMFRDGQKGFWESFASSN